MEKRKYMPKFLAEFIAPRTATYELLIEGEVHTVKMFKGQNGGEYGWVLEMPDAHFVAWGDRLPEQDGYYWCLEDTVWRLVGFKGSRWERNRSFSWWVDKCMAEFEDDEDIQMAILEAIRENTEALKELKQEIRNHGWTWLQPYVPPVDPNPWVTPDTTQPWKWGTGTIPCSGEVKTISDEDGVRMIYNSSGDYIASKNAQYSLTVGGKLPEDLITLT